VSLMTTWSYRSSSRVEELKFAVMSRGFASTLAALAAIPESHITRRDHARELLITTCATTYDVTLSQLDYRNALHTHRSKLCHMSIP